MYAGGLAAAARPGAILWCPKRRLGKRERRPRKFGLFVVAFRLCFHIRQSSPSPLEGAVHPVASATLELTVRDQ